MLRRTFELKYRESYEQEFSFFALYIVLVCYYVDKMSNEKLAQNLAGNLNILPPSTRQIQGGAEPTDTFQLVIDNIWKQGKISETVYKYVQVCYLLATDYKLIFWKLHQADGLRLHQCIVASVSGSCRTRASVGPHQ